MKLNFTILFAVTITVFLFTIFHEQILNRLSFFRKSRNYEGYFNHFTKKPHKLSTVLDNFNKNLQITKVENISKHSSFGKGNFTENIKLEVMPIVNRVLNDVNNLGNLRLKFTDLDRVEKLQDQTNNMQYLVSFFILSIDTHSSSKLIINFYRSPDNKVNINSIKKESDTLADVPNLTDNLVSYNHIPKENTLKQYKRTGVLDDNQTNDTTYGAPFSSMGSNINDKTKANTSFVNEPCNYNLHLWDSRGVNKRLKLRNRCKMTNNSQQLPPAHLYANPTVFSPILNEPREFTI